jgi:hypothetical protein
MPFRLILLSIVIFIIAIGIPYFFPQWKEGFDSGSGGLSGAHDGYVKDSSLKLNNLTNTFNLTNPAMQLNTFSADSVRQAVNTVDATPTSMTYQLSSKTTYSPPDSSPGTFQQAASCESAPSNCSAFDSPDFAQNCGMSFDVNGSSMDGRPFTGGLYISPDDREQQAKAFKNVQDNGTPPYDPFKVLQPTIGKAKSGTFATTKGECVVVKEKVDCEKKQTFNTPNCTQCYTTQTFSRVGPDTGRLPSALHLFGVGSASVDSPDHSIASGQVQLSLDKPIVVNLPPYAEGSSFNIYVNATGVPAGQPIYVAGFLKGPTARGDFHLDMMTLIRSDAISNAKPRIRGTATVGGIRCFTLMPGNGKSTMQLNCYMPFTFINMFDGDALACDNGPIITLADSATFLESDACYGKDNKPGNYKLECLQSRWIGAGGTTQGTGYPNHQETANKIQRDANNRPIVIDDIVDVLADKSSQAQTGLGANGKSLSIPDWNTVSMYMTGVPINTPCDGPNNAVGPLSKDCLSYLYTNQGVASRVGQTYTQNPGRVASGKVERFMDVVEDMGQTLAASSGNQSVVTMIEKFMGVSLAKDGDNAELKEQFENPPNTFNYPGTAIDPTTDAGLAFGQGIGGVAAVKQKYDDINRLANDNSKTNAQRADAVKKAYNVTLGSPASNLVSGAPQVFAAGVADGGYVYTREKGEQVCQALGATTATTAQLNDALAHGADWCFSGWTADGGGKWPITTSVIGGCGGRTGIIEWTPGDKAGVNCYGPKPDINDPRSKNLLPFNNQMWDQPTEPTYLTIPTGYLETTGPQPACFGGLSVDQAKKECNALGDRCVGFSYSKDGSGNGCYKGNHNAGMNNNGNYMGYVKAGAAASSGVVSGRYIKLEYNHVECLNLAQILVFATKGGPNIITPSTVVTKPDGWQGDVFPVQNFVDGRGDSFVHTSCGNVPWIQVDLGRTTTIYKVVVWNRNDCCQSRVVGTKLTVLNDDQEFMYISHPINTTNQTYTWFPPNPEVKVDVAEDAKYKSKETPWKCMNGWGAPMRKNKDGDVECMSTNHHDCLWGGPCGSLVQAPPRNTDPLTCGAMHAREWGGPGYDNGGHWCAIARNQI